MLTEATYICTKCGKLFESKEKCREHEITHSLCPCKYSDNEKYLWGVIGYGREIEGGIDFKSGKIYTVYYRSCDNPKTYSMPIKYCPLCGDELQAVAR